MPTSDADRYELLLQQYKALAAGIGMIREAVERAFDVRLLSATTMSGEFEIITRAIYAAAADRPRPARPTPVTNNKTDSRDRHTYRKVTLAYLMNNLSYPLPTKGGDILLTIQDARGHLLRLGPHQEVRPHWQRARELLLEEADVETLTSQFHRALFMDGLLDIAEFERINGARRPR